MKQKILALAIFASMIHATGHATNDGALFAAAVEEHRINKQWVDEYGYYPSFEPKAYTHWDDLAIFCGTTAAICGSFMALDKYCKSKKLSPHKERSLKKQAVCLAFMFGGIGGFLYHMHKCLNYQDIIDENGWTRRVYPEFGAAESYMKLLYGAEFIISCAADFYFIYNDIFHQSEEEALSINAENEPA